MTCRKLCWEHPMFGQKKENPRDALRKEAKALLVLFLEAEKVIPCHF